MYVMFTLLMCTHRGLHNQHTMSTFPRDVRRHAHSLTCDPEVAPLMSEILKPYHVHLLCLLDSQDPANRQMLSPAGHEGLPWPQGG